MKAKIKTLSWDSNFFGKKVGEITMDNCKTFEPSGNFDLIVVKETSDLPIEVEGFTETFQETKVIFCKDLKILNEVDSSIFFDTDNTNNQWEDFKNLAYESGKMSRFLQDPNFGEEKFTELYDQWIINSLNKKFAEKVFFISDNEKPISFVTIQKDNNIGKIGLIATLPEFQGKGLGKILLKFAENFCIEKGLMKMEIPTQGENKQACNFYEKLGYKLKEKMIIKHFWKK